MSCCHNAVYSQPQTATVTSHQSSYTSVPQEESYPEEQQDPFSQPADSNAPPPDYADGKFCLESVYVC